MSSNFVPVPSELRTPSSSEVSPPVPPPVETLIQELPFEQLEWINFEKLCLRLVEFDGIVEDCRLYGTRGQAQEGIDFYARPKTGEKYSVYQCKRVKNFYPYKIEKAVSKFLKGEWAKKSDTFVLCTSESFNTTKRSKTIEKQTKLLKNSGIKLISWDKDELSRKLKSYPEIVDDFFGRPWVKAFCGSEAADSLRIKLDSNEVIELRRQLLDFYIELFNEHDRAFSSFLNLEPPSFRERFIFPDINEKSPILFEKSQDESETSNRSNREFQSRPDAYQLAKSAQDVELSHSKDVSSLQYKQRKGIEEWLKNSDKNIILGDPGSGKSTLLKFIAINLLSESPQLNLISEKWGNLIPVWVPFGLWTNQISIQNIDNYSLSNLIKKWLKSWDREHIWPLIEKGISGQNVLLLVDGLDEWASEDAAKSAFSRFKLFIKDSKIPFIITSRPHGFERLGIQEIDWQVGHLSDFSMEQQMELSKIWFTFLIKNQRLSDGEEILDGGIGKEAGFETETLMNELKESSELKELVKNPLLLSLIIYHKFKKYNLPQSRFKAYESIIKHLVTEHPRTRAFSADSVGSSDEQVTEDIELILEYLAYHIQKNHRNGIIEVDDARNYLISYLVDKDGDFGFSQYQARKFCLQFLEVSEDVIGIIVKQSFKEIGFLHRVFQEYLAARYISKQSLDEQKSIIQTNCANPQWQEVLLSLFNATDNPGVIQAFIQDIRSEYNSLNQFERYVVELLLFEIVFGDYNCPIKIAEELSTCAFDKVELDSWMPHRERVLNLILLGLNSRLKRKVQSKLRCWFPDRGFVRRYIFDAMATWPKSSSVVECLWKGLYDEELENKRSAALSLTILGKKDPEIEKNIVKLAKNAIDYKVRAVAIEALINGWHDNKELYGILEANSNSKSQEIQLIKVIGRIKVNVHTERDLDKLLQLGRIRSGLEWCWRDTIVSGLINGWSRNEKVKKACMESEVGSPNNKLDSEIALKILVEGYPQDEEVAHFFANRFVNDEHPLIPLTHKAKYYNLLATNFRGNSELVAAVDSWASKLDSKVHDDEIAMLSSIGCTSKIKSILLSSLDTINSTSHWATEALLENWGMDDVEVSDKLTKMVDDPGASRIAHLFPQIIKDKTKCRKRLVELLKKPNGAWYGSVLLGLKKLDDDVQDDPEVVEIVLASPSLLENRIIDDVLSILIHNYPSNEKVKELAKKELYKQDGRFEVVASEYGGDEYVRKKIIEMACPLPSQLREIIVTYLGDQTPDEFTLSLLKLYDHEENELVKTQASISYYNLLKSSKNDLKDDLRYLSETIVCYGPDHEERRKAAFCGLVILKRLDIMLNAKETIGSDRLCSISTWSMSSNIPLLRLILENWEYIKSFFGDEFWLRFSLEPDSLNSWDMLSILADEYEPPKSELTDILQNTENKKPTENILKFMARSKPNNRLILDYCLNVLCSGEDQLGSWRLSYNAAELLSETFFEDKEVLNYLTELYNNQEISMENFLLLLCEGWPNSLQLELLFKQIRYNNTSVPLVIRYQLICKKTQTEIVFNNIKRDLSNLISLNTLVASFVTKALVGRIKKDNELHKKLLEYLNDDIDPSSKISILKLVVMSRGMSSEVREECIKELNLQLNPQKTPEIGFDLTTGQLNPVVNSLLDLL